MAAPEVRDLLEGVSWARRMWWWSQHRKPEREIFRDGTIIGITWFAYGYEQLSRLEEVLLEVMPSNDRYYQ